MCHSSSLFPTIVNNKYPLNTRAEDQNLCPTPSMRRCFTSNPYDTGLSNDQNVSDFYIFKAMCHSSSLSLPSVSNKKSIIHQNRTPKTTLATMSGPSLQRFSTSNPSETGLSNDQNVRGISTIFKVHLKTLGPLILKNH